MPRQRHPEAGLHGFEDDWQAGPFAVDVLVAHNSRGEWGICRTPGGVAQSLDGTVAVTTPQAGSAYLDRQWNAKSGTLTVAGLVGPDVKHVQLTTQVGAGRSGPADIRDGSFAVQFEAGPAATPPALTITLMNSAYQPIYSGALPRPGRA